MEADCIIYWACLIRLISLFMRMYIRKCDRRTWWTSALNTTVVYYSDFGLMCHVQMAALFIYFTVDHFAKKQRDTILFLFSTSLSELQGCVSISLNSFSYTFTSFASSALGAAWHRTTFFPPTTLQVFRYKISICSIFSTHVFCPSILLLQWGLLKLSWNNFITKI